MDSLAKPYEQPWVVGDVIGCCIDLEGGKILFYRNGVPLGVAFDGICRNKAELSYYLAISLSEEERCNLNCGSRPFKYPIDGFLPLSRVLELQCLDKFDLASFERLRRVKRFSLFEELFYPIFHGISEELFSIVGTNESTTEYIAWGSLLSVLLELFELQAPHDSVSLDRVIGLFLEYPGSRILFQHLLMALSSNCRIAPLVLMECPFCRSCPFLALACHILKHEELGILWWKSADYEYSFEGIMSRKCPNKQDLQPLIPSVWRPGSFEESNDAARIYENEGIVGIVKQVAYDHAQANKPSTLMIPFGRGEWSGFMNQIHKDMPLDEQPEYLQKLTQGSWTLRQMCEGFQKILKIVPLGQVSSAPQIAFCRAVLYDVMDVQGSISNIDPWSAGCLLAEMFAGRLILPGTTEIEQQDRIFKLCGSPSGDYWKRFQMRTSIRPPQPYIPSISEIIQDFPSSSWSLIIMVLAMELSYSGSTSAAAAAVVESDQKLWRMASGSE